MNDKPMRVLHIVTLVSPNGSFGGPLSVAVNQIRQLRDQGNEALLLGASEGFVSIPKEFNGAPVVLFEAKRAGGGHGFANIYSFELMIWLMHNARKFDLVHIHLSRDMLTMPAALIIRSMSIPYVVQTHGMITHSTRRAAFLFDAFLTKRALNSASMVLALSSTEQADLEKVLEMQVNSEILVNGVPVPTESAPETEARKDVLFAARLHARKNPVLFVQMAIALAQEFPEYRFVLVGPDEGQLDDVRHAISSARLYDRVVYEGPVPPELMYQKMRRAALYVLPAVDEPFGMTVVEAMSAGTPVVLGEGSVLAPWLEQSQAGKSFDGSLDSLIATVRECLSSPEWMERAGEMALRSVKAEYSMERVGTALESIYRRLLANIPRNGRSPAQGPKASRKVVIIQPYISEYRVGFFQRLTGRLASEGIELVVAAGLPVGAQAKRSDAASSNWIFPVKRYRLVIRGRSIVASNAHRIWAGADAVIASHKGSSFETMLAILWGRRRGRKVAVWGHIASYTSVPHPLDAWVERWQLRHVDHIFAYTSSGRDFALKAGAPAANVTSVMNTIDTATLQAAQSTLNTSDVDSFIAEHRIPRKKLFMFLGGLDESKRIAFLRATLDILYEADADIHLLVAGRGREEHLLLDCVRRGQVTLLGYADDRAKAIMARLAIGIVMPGRVGLLAVDALVLSIPVLTTDWNFHAPEIEYLEEGISKFTSSDDVQDFAKLILSASRGMPSVNQGAPTIPSIEEMVENFAGGIKKMLDS